MSIIRQAKISAREFDLRISVPVRCSTATLYLEADHEDHRVCFHASKAELEDMIELLHLAVKLLEDD